MLGHRRNASETPWADGPWAGGLIVVSTEIKQKTLSKLNLLWQNFLDPRMSSTPLYPKQVFATPFQQMTQANGIVSSDDKWDDLNF